MVYYQILYLVIFAFVFCFLTIAISSIPEHNFFYSLQLCFPSILEVEKLKQLSLSNFSIVLKHRYNCL